MRRKRTGAGTIGAFNQANAAVQKLLKVNWHDPRECAFDRFGGLRHGPLHFIDGRTLVLNLVSLFLFRFACLSSTCRLRWKSVMTALKSHAQVFSVEDLWPRNYQRWRDLRRQLQQREEARRQQWRFRKKPAAYLAEIEAHLL